MTDRLLRRGGGIHIGPYGGAGVTEVRSCVRVLPAPGGTANHPARSALYFLTVI
jgi:hypothetical protein